VTRAAPRTPIPLLFGPYGGLPEELTGAARDSGVNAVWFHMFQDAEFERCARHGLAACVELKTLRADFARRPELIPTGADGSPIRYGELVQGVCLSHTSFIAEIEGALEEGLRSYRPAGIWLDYLTYAGWFETPEPDLQESCFCDACIEEFCVATGIDAEAPAVILERNEEAWTRHKCERIAGLANRLARTIRARLPGCVVGAYMCPWRPDEHGGALTSIFAQDHGILADAVDVFTPLIYAAKSGRPPLWSREYLDASPGFVPAGRKVQLILDFLDYPASMLEAASAAVPTWGIQLFGGAGLFADKAAASTFRSSVSRIRAACA